MYSKDKLSLIGNAVQSRFIVSGKQRESVWAGGAKSQRVLWICVATMLWLHLLFLIDYWHGMKRGYTDFSVLYTAGTILREGLGHQLYNRETQYRVQEDFTGSLPFRRGPLPYIHPPFEAPIFVPLAFLDYQQAFVTWDILTLCTLFAVGFLLRQSIPILFSVLPWKFVLGALAFYPVFTCFLQGQDSILQLLFCAAGFQALRKKADIFAGCCFAMGAFKFQFMIPLVFLLFVWGRRRIAIGFAVIAAALALVSLGIVGRDALLQYPRFALQIVEVPGLGGVPLALMPNLHGLVVGWRGPLSGTTGLALAIIASILVVSFAAWTGQVRTSLAGLELQFSLAIIVSVLIGWQTNAHDLSLLVIPLVLLADYCFHTVPPKSGFTLLLPVVPLLITPFWMALWLSFAKVNLMAIPMLWWVWVIGKELSHVSQKEFSNSSKQWSESMVTEREGG
jgi:hypothetical protein